MYEVKKSARFWLIQLQGIEPKHQKEVLQLEAEIRGAEAKYNEAMANAAKETDPAKKAQFIALAQTAERTVKQAKQKLNRNPLSKYIEYSNLIITLQKINVSLKTFPKILGHVFLFEHIYNFSNYHWNIIGYFCC